MKKIYEEPAFEIARFTLQDALLKESVFDDESSIVVDGDSSGSNTGNDPGDILGQ